MEKFYTVKKSCDENPVIRFTRIVSSETKLRKSREADLRRELLTSSVGFYTTTPSFEGNPPLPEPQVKMEKSYISNLEVKACEDDKLVEVSYDLWVPTLETTQQHHSVTDLNTKTGPFWARKKLYLQEVRQDDCIITWKLTRESYLASSVEYKDLVFNVTTIEG